MTRLEKDSPCKVNLLLNILGKRPDGFHELETVMHPVNLCDRISFERAGNGIALTCSDASLPVDSTNLVHRAAAAFVTAANINEGVRLHLVKNIPMAAGLGGGSGNAATTLLGLNDLFGHPLSAEKLDELAAALGSDVNFFLQNKPALATGRGEKVESLAPFSSLQGAAFLLIHPGFGISTAWAYQKLARFPAALNGQPGRARELVALLASQDLPGATPALYNSLEAPALDKYPILELFQEFLRENGAAATLMSGSGSTTFAIVSSASAAESLCEKFRGKFGTTNWTMVVPIP
jgi:4-diphosphocytidyl-2-C-methyl-D-erythritol kinase